MVHQITDTFASVSQSDLSWTEKVWAMAADTAGSVQLVFGLGVYPNRGVTDAFGGVSRGVEQWTVRASTRLGRDSTDTAVGPLRYEVLEPFERVRFSLGESRYAPIAFEWLFEGAVPPVLENREVHRGASGRRVAADIVRYHQVGTASGWVEIDGERTEMEAETWVTARDHSWGVRYGVGSPVGDAVPEPDRSAVSSLVMWCPVLCRRPDGTSYGLHWYYQRHSFGSHGREELQGGVENPDRSKLRFVSARPDVSFDDHNRRFVGGTIDFGMEDGTVRPLRLRPVSDTGYHLGAGLYLGYDDHFHGQWRGEGFAEGEYISDCSAVDVATTLHQLRDCVIEVEDPVGGGTGYGNLQSIVTGAHPEMGLTAESSFT